MDQCGRQREAYTNWRKSSYSGGTENSDCVEIAVADESVALRDSKNAAGPMLTFASSGWRAFLASR